MPGRAWRVSVNCCSAQRLVVRDGWMRKKKRRLIQGERLPVSDRTSHGTKKASLRISVGGAC